VLQIAGWSLRPRARRYTLTSLLAFAACVPELGGTRSIDSDAEVSRPGLVGSDGGDGTPNDAGGDDDDAGAEGCGDAVSGQHEERQAFAALSVTSPGACESETQVRTCEDGRWSRWSGSFNYAACTVSYRSCEGVAHGASESRMRYPAAIVDDYQACTAETQTRVCNDGTFSGWSGSAAATSCEVALYGVCSKSSTCHEGQCASSHTMFFTSQCLVPDGGTCTEDDQCINTCVGGVCAPEASAGQACDGAGDCNVLACTGAPASASCTDQLCQCPSGVFCTSNDQCVGTCAALSCRPINTVCDTGDAADCTGAFSCVSKRCVLPEGSACNANSVCRNACRELICAPLGTYGQICDESADCANGLACSKTAGSDGHRVCLLDTGVACSAASACASNKCSCTGQNCTRRCGF
jgi:hypothetical protein